MPSEKSMERARKISLSGCPRCNGRGIVTVRHGTIFDTDSPDERRDAFHEERCPECDAVIATTIDEAVAAALAADRKARIVRCMCDTCLKKRAVREEKAEELEKKDA